MEFVNHHCVVEVGFVAIEPSSRVSMFKDIMIGPLEGGEGLEGARTSLVYKEGSGSVSGACSIVFIRGK